MTWDMEQDVKACNVPVVSIWPGSTATERSVSILSQTPGGEERIKSLETPQFTGRVIEALYGDPNLMMKSGQVVIGAEAAVEYGFTDINGNQPLSLREQRGSPHPFGV